MRIQQALARAILTGLAALAALAPIAVHAADPIKIGLIVPMTGPFSYMGRQIGAGVSLYLAQNGNTVAGRKVEIILKDDAGSPDTSRRLAQELVVNDKVTALAGFGLTPQAFSTATIATQSKTPRVVMNAATSAITTKSNYLVRASMTLPQNTAPIASWAAKNGIKNVFTLVADFGPGHDAEGQFKKTFSAAGGRVVGEVRVPVSNPDYGPYLQKIKDVKPDAVFLFLPPGAGTIAFMKGFAERGLAASGIRLIATGDLSDEEIIDAIGEPAVGLVTSFHYSEAHKSAENAAYTAAYAKAYPKDRPNFMSVGGYDGMHLIAEVLKKTNGDASGDKFIEAAKGMKWVSPRGPVTIDAATRDIVQTIYIRKVEKIAGKLQNVEFDQVVDFKDPGKE